MKLRWLIALSLTAACAQKTPPPAAPQPAAPALNIYGTFVAHDEVGVKSPSQKKCLEMNGAWIAQKCVLAVSHTVTVQKEDEHPVAKVSFEGLGNCTLQGPALIVDEKTVSLLVRRNEKEHCHFILNYQSADRLSLKSDGTCGCPKSLVKSLPSMTRVTDTAH